MHHTDVERNSIRLDTFLATSLSFLCIFTLSSNNGIPSASIKKNEIDMKLKIFTLDKKAQDYFREKNIESFEFTSNYIGSQDEMFFQNSENFGYLMMAKFEIIYDQLQSNEYVLYIDGDIVINEPFIKELYFLPIEGLKTNIRSTL